ncbi:MAG: ATP-binding protein [Myxococcota bacterium]
MLEHAQLAIAVYGTSGKCIYTTSTMASMMGTTLDTWRATSLWEVSAWKAAGVVHDAVMTLADGDVRARYVDIPGRDRRSQVTLYRLQEGQQDVVAIVAVPASQSMVPPARATAQDLASFAAATAHRVNNGLVPATCALDMLAEELGDSKVTKMLISQAIDAIERVAQGVTAAAAVMESAPRGSKHFSLAGVLAEVQGSLTQRANACLLVDRLAFEELPTLPGCAEEVRGAIRHVIDNALESSEGLPVRISAEQVRLDAPLLLTTGEQLPPGRYIAFAVSDQGPGFEADHLERATLPFFSTKGLGRGLGLASAARVARDHGGGIDLEQGNDDETIVRIWMALDARAL